MTSVGFLHPIDVFLSPFPLASRFSPLQLPTFTYIETSAPRVEF